MNTQLEDDIHFKSESIDALNSEIAHLRDEFKSVQAKMREMKTRLEDDIHFKSESNDALNTQVAHLQDDLTSVQSKIPVLMDEIADLQKL
jgi:uncharacterized coiled-coil protein SlyX